MLNGIMGLFGKTTQKSPRDQCRDWTRKLRQQDRLLDREVRKIQMEEDKIKIDLKAAAKKNDKEVCLILAKELIRSKKAKNRIHAAKSQINSISMIIQEQMATVRMAGSLQKSTEVMKSMQNLVSVQNISTTMQEMSREMMKTGIISEMMDEAIEEAIDGEEEIDEEAQAEVDKIMSELNVATGEKLAHAPSTAPAAQKQAQEEASTSKEAEEAEDEEDMKKMQRRLEMLKT